MVDLNIGNAITIAIISVLGWAAIQWLLTTFNINIPFLSAA